MCNVLGKVLLFLYQKKRSYDISQIKQDSAVYYVFFLLANKIIANGLSSKEFELSGLLYGVPDSLVDRYLFISSHLQ